MTISEASSSDVFFYWDSLDEDICMEADLLAMLLQTKGRLFYNRSYGCGVQTYEGPPNTLLPNILLRFDIVNGFSDRNQRVTDGSRGYPDRRALTSQAAVEVEQEGPEMNLAVGYVRMKDADDFKTISVPWRA